MNTVKRSQLTNKAMSNGGEEVITKVIDYSVPPGVLKNWVGIGWVDERLPTEEDKQNYPVIQD